MDRKQEVFNVCFLKCIFLEEKPGSDITEKKQFYEKIMKPKQFVCRVYILDGINLMTPDLQDDPDLYLVLKLGDKELNLQRQSLREKTMNPQFYVAQEISCEYFLVYVEFQGLPT